MKIKLPSLTKAEKILALLNQWDPEKRVANGAGYRAYNYEAETIAQHVRSNSKAESVEKAINDVFDSGMKDEEVKTIAECILMAVKSNR